MPFAGGNPLGEGRVVEDPQETVNCSVCGNEIHAHPQARGVLEVVNVIDVDAAGRCAVCRYVCAFNEGGDR